MLGGVGGWRIHNVSWLLNMNSHNEAWYLDALEGSDMTSHKVPSNQP